MADRQHLTRAQLVERLADAFEVLLEQVAELKHHNGEVNKLLGREQKVRTPNIVAARLADFPFS